jgi:hypothetical protein
VVVANMADGPPLNAGLRGDPRRTGPPRPDAGGAPSAEPAPQALVICPQCQAGVPAEALDTHLRQAHRLFQFRGRRYAAGDLRAFLLDNVVAKEPAADAWDMLEAMTREEQDEEADAYLAGLLAAWLGRVAQDQRRPVTDAVGALLGRRGAARLAPVLASAPETAARHLALVIVGRLPQPLDASLQGPLRALLADHHLPIRPQLEALAAMLRTVGNDGPLPVELLNALVGGLKRPRAIERLRRLEQMIGPAPVIETFCVQLEENLRMSCPRCGVELRRPEMVQHLWEQHRLVLEGRRVREPWQLIEEWLDAYRDSRDPRLLERGEELVRRLDPERGPGKLHRLMVARGLAEADRQQLLEEARQEHAACCPWCYALVPVPRESPPRALMLRRGRLSGGGYVVNVSDRDLRTSLEVRTADDLIYRDREPDRTWTAGGALLLGAGPIVLLALAWACWGPAPFWPVCGLLGAAFIAAMVMHGLWRPSASAEHRARRYAWELLAPHLHERGFVAEDSAFLAGLAQLSLDDGLAAVRAGVLPTLLKHTELAVSRRQGVARHLALLRRLAVEDAAAAGADPVPLVLEQLTRSFQGRMPLTVAEYLLEGWRNQLWTQVNLERLRVLLCDRAFEAGFEVRNLLDAGQKSPALGAVLKTTAEKELAALRLLWSLRASRPWDRCGDAKTVFEVATDPERAKLLVEYPDLLLYQEEPSWPPLAPEGGEVKPVRILFCLRGLFLQGTLIDETPRSVELSSTGQWQMLILGPHRFYSRGDLDTLMLRMERWCRYAFSEFLPAVAGVLSWRSPNRSAILRAWGAQPCPECKRPLLPLMGQVGIALDEAEVQPEVG